VVLFFILSDIDYIYKQTNMNKQEAEQRLASMRAGARREALVQSGAYDGRYRSRVVQSKKHKVEKHKRRALDHEYPRN
jgi:hypothetical protein